MPLTEWDRAVGGRGCKAGRAIAGFKDHFLIGRLLGVDKEGKAVAVPTAGFIGNNRLNVSGSRVELYPCGQRKRWTQIDRAGIQELGRAVEEFTFAVVTTRD